MDFFYFTSLSSDGGEDSILFGEGSLGLGNSLAFEVLELSLTLIPGLGLHLSLGLKLSNSISVFPTTLRSKSATELIHNENKNKIPSKVSERALGLQSQDSKSRWDNHFLDLIVWRRHSVKDLKATKSTGTLVLLVGKHSSNGLPEDLGWGTVVERSLLRVGGSSLAQVDQKLVLLL